MQNVRRELQLKTLEIEIDMQKRDMEQKIEEAYDEIEKLKCETEKQINQLIKKFARILESSNDYKIKMEQEIYELKKLIDIDKNIELKI